ncbi:MAG: NarK/NasA family nitrate transporter [Saprospirales bacterium]|nr:NarK/NasA family nitrate transporter [Saprospirales bacterium]
MATWFQKWEPEDPAFWQQKGAKQAWRTLAVTTFGLIFSFATWFVMSAVVVRMPDIGFQFSTMQLFWLTAMPGLAGGTFRLIHSFLIPIYGSRHVITISMLIKLLPMIWLFLAVQDLSTPYWHFIAIAFLCGFGGGDFSSYIPSTSLFFPKKLLGMALGLQAGIGNFGVSLTQFITPWIIGFAAFGGLAGGSQMIAKGDTSKEIWLQNAAFWYIPFLALTGVFCWFVLRSIPVKATFKEQLDIFKSKHTWYCTITYVMTFGSFAGFSASFPLMIKELYGSFPDAPDPLKYAFYGPLIGSAMRALMGKATDRWGGSIFTQLSGMGLIACCLALVLGGYLQPASMEQFPGFVMLMLGIFFFTGIGNASTFRQYPIIFAYNARQAAGVIGFTAAVAAYGPFVFSLLIGKSISLTGGAATFFWGAIAFFALACWINWYFYTRKDGERCDFGTSGGTWWDKAKSTWSQN